jgi:hypothetical protein
MAARSESAKRNASSLARIRSQGVFAKLSSSNEPSTSPSDTTRWAETGSCLTDPFFVSSAPGFLPLAFMIGRLRQGPQRSRLTFFSFWQDDPGAQLFSCTNAGQVSDPGTMGV